MRGSPHSTLGVPRTIAPCTKTGAYGLFVTALNLLVHGVECVVCCSISRWVNIFFPRETAGRKGGQRYMFTIVLRIKNVVTSDGSVSDSRCITFRSVHPQVAVIYTYDYERKSRRMELDSWFYSWFVNLVVRFFSFALFSFCLFFISATYLFLHFIAIDLPLAFNIFVRERISVLKNLTIYLLLQQAILPPISLSP